MEKRNFDRTTQIMDVALIIDGKPYACDLIDISLNGMCVSIREDIGVRDEVLAIVITSKVSGIPQSFKITGKAVRIERHRIGIHFIMDVESFCDLKKLISQIEVSSA